MVSTPTSNLRLEQQPLGSNLNTWGDDRLNQVLRMVDAAVTGQVSIALTNSDYTLSAVNYSTDESRQSTLVLTGTLSANVNVIVPASYTKLYLVVNNTTGGPVGVKTAVGTGVQLRPGPQWVWCDGSTVYVGMPSLDQIIPPNAPVAFNGQAITGAGAVAMGGTLTGVTSVAMGGAITGATTIAMNGALTGMAAPSNNTDGANKFYVDNATFAASTSVFPAQAGNAGYVITTDGTVGSWSDSGAIQWGGTAGGSATAITLTMVPAMPRYTAGTTIRFVASVTSQYGVTLNVNNLGAKTILSSPGDTAPNNSIQSGGVYQVTYDGTSFRLLPNSGAPDYLIQNTGII